MRHPRASRWHCTILVAGALIANAPSVHAARIAPCLGLNMATLGFSDEVRLLRFDQPLQGEIPLQNQTQFGMAVGVDAAWMLSSHVSIVTGVGVSMQGGALRGDELLRVAQAPNAAVRTIAEFDYELAYLNVPLTLRLVRPWSTGNAYVGAGPLLGVLLHDQVTQSIRTAAADLSFDPIPPPSIPNTTLSVLLTAGFEAPFQRGHGFLEVSLAQGLTTALETVSPKQNVRQRVFGVSTGIRY